LKRALTEELIKWRNDAKRSPLLLRGARQVGKSYLIESFGRANFQRILSINFERDPRYKACFNELVPQKIMMQLELLWGQKIVAGETLLFLDEIQECPAAIQSLRYFKEEYPDLHVIGAGSLLEFVLQQSDFSMPVGRVQFLYLKPLSFKEFLWANQKEHYCEYLSQLRVDANGYEVIHRELLEQLRLYLILGGMPGVLNKYFETGSVQEARLIQLALLQAYRADFGKYSKHHEHGHLETVFAKLPAFTSQQIKYSKLDSETPSRQIKLAIEKLALAGLLTQVFATSGSGLPFVAHKNERKFKALFLDVGLMLRACQVDPQVLVQEDILFLMQGAMMEQLVGQELLAYENPYETPELFFWERENKNAQAEVDYLLAYRSKILPIEVKSKSLGHLKSLKRFMQEKQSHIGIRIAEHPLSLHENILSVPLYMIFELPNLLANIQ